MQAILLDSPRNIIFNPKAKEPRFPEWNI